jgi:hypothetical protein
MRRLGIVGVVLIAWLHPAGAADDGCEKFAWSVARERVWFAASDKTSVAVGETLTSLPKGAIVVRLQPAAQAPFEMPPERKSQADQWFGGAVRIPAVERPGIYQVTLSAEAWIDVVQDMRYARTVGHSGRGDCPGIRKSVRLELGPIPFAVQLSGASSETIVMAISPAE